MPKQTLTKLSEPASRASITTEQNRIRISGVLGISALHFLLAVIDRMVTKQGCRDLILDFSGCSAVFQGPMMAVCAQILRLRAEGIGAQLIAPHDVDLAQLFRNTSWGHFVDPERQPASSFRGTSRVPVIQFTSPREQSAAVNTIMNALLGSLRGFSREDLAAIEWSVNEITDNVIVHAESQTGGLVQVSTYPRRRRVEYVVADAGIGIPQSLRRGLPELTSDTDALFHAVKEGVTRDKAIGQGNGLYGSYEICRRSGGYFEIHSGFARMGQSEAAGLQVRREQVAYRGTLVVAAIDYSKPDVLAEALQFGRTRGMAFDYVEGRYEVEGEDRPVFVMRSEAASVGSRVAGRPVRTKLENLIDMYPDRRIGIDFDGIVLVSSSFADEVFGKLFVKLGATSFSQRIELFRINETVKQLIDRAIVQRMAHPGNQKRIE